MFKCAIGQALAGKLAVLERQGLLRPETKAQYERLRREMKACSKKLEVRCRGACGRGPASLHWPAERFGPPTAPGLFISRKHEGG